MFVSVPFSVCFLRPVFCLVACGKGMCRVRYADGHIAGTPCQDWSFAGHRRGACGKTFIAFLAWCRCLLSDSPAWAIHENVVGFDYHILVALLGSVFNIYVLWVDPSDCGFNLIARKRQYIILLHRHKAELVHDVVAMYEVMKTALSECATRPSDCMVADADEVIGATLELEAKRHGSASKRRKRTDGVSQGCLLTPPERQRMRQLCALWQKKTGTTSSLVGTDRHIQMVQWSTNKCKRRPIFMYV